MAEHSEQTPWEEQQRVRAAQFDAARSQIDSRREKEQRTKSNLAINELLASTHFKFKDNVSHPDGDRRDLDLNIDAKKVDQILNAVFPEKSNIWECVNMIALFELAAEWGWINLDQRHLSRHTRFVWEATINSLNEIQSAKPTEQERQQFTDNLIWFFKLNEAKYKSFYKRWYPAIEAEDKRRDEEKAVEKAEEERRTKAFKDYVKLSPYERDQFAKRANKQEKEDIRHFTEWEEKMRPEANKTYDEFAREMGFHLTSQEIEEMLNTLFTQHIPAQKVAELMQISRLAEGIFTDESDYELTDKLVLFLKDREDVDAGEMASNLFVYSQKYFELIKEKPWLARIESFGRPSFHQKLRRFFQLNERKLDDFFVRWMGDVQAAEARQASNQSTSSPETHPWLERRRKERSEWAIVRLLRSAHFFAGNRRSGAGLKLTIEEIYQILDDVHPENQNRGDCQIMISLFEFAAKKGWVAPHPNHDLRHAAHIEGELNNAFDEILESKSDDTQQQYFVDDLMRFFTANEVRYAAFLDKWVPAIKAKDAIENEKRAREKDEEERLLKGLKNS
jgi:hypothetical protein